jgi:rhamnosyltransferase subunit B
MRFAIVTLGSLGDLNPFIEIAVELVRRGHDVELLTSPKFEARVRARGIAFHPIGAPRDAERTEEHPDLWHPIRGFGVLWRHLCVPAMRPTFDRLAALSKAGGEPLRVLSSALSLGARVAAEVLPIRHWTGITSPIALRSVADPMFVGAWRVPAAVPASVRRWMWRGLDAMKLQPMLRPSLLAWRHELGLPEITGSVFGEWVLGGGRTLALYPEWFAPPPPDAPSVAYCGFVMPALNDDDESGPLWDFVRRDSAPVVMYPGSGARWSRRFLGVCAEAAAAMGCRALFVTPHVDQCSDIRTASDFVVNEAPFAKLLPRAAAIVHHGGIGTCAESLRSACGQVLLPSAYDQFDNAVRITERAAGAWMPAGCVTPSALRPLIQRALDISNELRRYPRNRMQAGLEGASAAADQLCTNLATQKEKARQLLPTGLPG